MSPKPFLTGLILFSAAHAADDSFRLVRQDDKVNVYGKKPEACVSDGASVMFLVENKTKERLELKLELLNLKVKNTLTVRGTKAPTVQPTEDAELRIYSAERVSGAFERSFRLPEHVDGNAIQATFQNGVLSISVPKKPASQPRKIAINSSEPAIAG